LYNVILKIAIPLPRLGFIGRVTPPDHRVQISRVGDPSSVYTHAFGSGRVKFVKGEHSSKGSASEGSEVEESPAGTTDTEEEGSPDEVEGELSSVEFERIYAVGMDGGKGRVGECDESNAVRGVAHRRVQRSPCDRKNPVGRGESGSYQGSIPPARLEVGARVANIARKEAGGDRDGDGDGKGPKHGGKMVVENA